MHATPPLATPPADDRAQALWLQHAAGKLLLETTPPTRECARQQLPPPLSENARAAALQAIDGTVYGLMQLQGDVTDPLVKGDHYVTLRTGVQLRSSHDDAVLHALDVLHGDGSCMAGCKAILAMRR